MRPRGFTLSELLIALVILGLISTFTIPKVIQSQQGGKSTAIAKEAMSMASGAFQAYKQQNTLIASTTNKQMSPFMNYVAVDTTSVLDNVNGYASVQCSATDPCLKLHNGGTMFLENTQFCSTDPTAAVWFMVDPDGGYSGSTTGAGKSFKFALFFNGRLTSRGSTPAGTYVNCFVQPVDSTLDPSWFSWN